MKRYAIFGLIAFACFSVRAETLELTGIRYAGYTTNAVPAGFSILAVPFSGFDTNGFTLANASLNELISTNGLTIGDRLIVFNEASTNYNYYSLTGTGWNPLPVAEIGTGSTNYVTILPGESLSTITKAQGYAFWLKTTNATIAQLQGIVNTNAAGVSIAANSFTLIGNALPGALDLNDPSFTNANTWCTVGPPGFGDEIHVVAGSNYVKNVFVGGRWKLVEQPLGSTVFTNDAANISAGSGLWYLRHGTNATFKLP